MTQPALFAESGLVCEHCGESSQTQFMHDLNHHRVGGLCLSQSLALNHIAYLTKNPQTVTTPQMTLQEEIARARELQIPTSLILKAQGQENIS